MLKTYQECEDFLSAKIEKLHYQQAKSLIEFYIQDFIAKIPSEFYRREISEEQGFFKQLYELVKIDIAKWDWQKIQQVIDDLDQNCVEVDDYPEDCFGLDLYNLIIYYKDFLNVTQDFHWITFNILMIYFGSLCDLLNMKTDDKTWATNPHITPYLETLQNQLSKINT